MHHFPLISVIIPTFNRYSYLEETLTSVSSQVYRNWECIIVDDGSTDKSIPFIKQFIAKDERFTLLKRPENRKKGASTCRNIGLEYAQGDYIQFLDSDDLIHGSKFEEQIKRLRKASKMAVSTCRWGSFSGSSQLQTKSKWHSYGNFNESLELLDTFGKYDEYFPPIVYLVPRTVIKRAGYWAENLSHNDDGEYFSRVILNASEITFCDKTEAYYRAGENERLSILDDEQKIRSAIESWKMIKRNLKDHKRVCNRYTSNGIRNVYEKIKDSHPELLEEYAEFFRKNIKPLKWYHRFTSR